MLRDEALATLTAPGARFETAEEEVGGWPMPVFARRLPHLRAVAEIAARRGAERTFLVSGERRYSFPGFVASASAVGHGLAGRFGVGPGDRVAVLAQNCAEWCLTAWAAIDMGAILVGLNGWWQADEIVFGLRDSGARVLVADRKRLDRVADRLHECPELRGVVLIDGDFDTLMRSGGRELPEVPIAEDDPAVILYTSGTTGRPKGAVGTHRNIIAGMQLAALGAQVRALTAGGAPARAEPGGAPVSLLTSPLFHVSGCQGVLIPGLLTGMTLVLIEGRIEPAKCFAAIESERVNLWATVPTLVWRVCSSGAASGYDLGTVRRVVFGGSPAAAELQRVVRRTFPGAVSGAGTNNYGLTETNGVISSLAAEEAAEHPGTVGRPLPTVQVRISEDGEILVRGAMVSAGYWNPPDQAPGTDDGWLHTGDIGHLDADGYLSVTDRAKDVIIRGGENVYCVEIEARLVEHPAILDAAVVGVPHAELGEEVKAIVQTVPGAWLSADAARAWVASALAAFKVPAHVELRVEPLPRGATGKLLKAELRAG